mmetsp:Transcript_22591/g.63418  ORF Transcript_22591/g.63418 Transcript_22591/m.63418 type:complete len:397 (+) Transcript_22591:79-1269(+)|eukprot:CAMPEP_0119132402 /NCGR_PEP_ID=MMETSP1310-20130426/11817_1 /TAXON_ID=464262 /ORGANISM="Genus nov. species nov., Strain RCC2339" /LENGTH=396 /DNA_ID=CAMNT_0007123035 /DNA_START=92 /DNA_END=1279 /DNA_ORIENTATION=+
MASSTVFSSLQTFDFFPKTAEEYRVRTLSGAVISVLCVSLVIYLFATELNAYLSVDVVPELSVDTTFGERLRINVDVVFPAAPCEFMSLDAMDVSGEHQLGITHNIYKQRLGRDGKPLSEDEVVDPGKKEDTTPPKPAMKVPETKPGCGSCYGAERNEGDCCNTCEDVQKAYSRKGWSFTGFDTIAQCVNEGYKEKMMAQTDEGCRFYGYLQVKKVQGNFHFSPGRSFDSHHSHVHDINVQFMDKWNMSHRIERVSFGQDYPGIQNPMDGVEKISTDAFSSTYSYFVKIVPTTYTAFAGEEIRTNQYSVTEHYRPVEKPNPQARGGQHHGLPGVFFHYDLSPIQVTYTETRESLGQFLASLCAIIGGIFSIAGLVDALMYRGLRTKVAKERMGKFG